MCLHYCSAQFRPRFQTTIFTNDEMVHTPKLAWPPQLVLTSLGNLSKVLLILPSYLTSQPCKPFAVASVTIGHLTAPTTILLPVKQFEGLNQQ